MAAPTLPEQIAARLRRAILRGDLEPGAAIKEREQAAAMAVSRTPMREAIRILAQEGLITLRPARSPIVADPTLQEVENDIDVLRVLELLSGARACERANAGDVAEMRRLHETYIDQIETGDMLDLFEIDMALHAAIARAAHNASLEDMHQRLMRRMWRTRYLSAGRRRDTKRVIRQHAAIIDAIETGDADRVRAEMTTHIDSLHANIRSHFNAATTDGATENTRKLTEETR